MPVIPLKHHLAYTERWTSPEVSKALQIGSAFHKIAEGYYDDRTALPPVTEVLDSLNEEYREIVAWMWDGYQVQYGLDKNWEILDVEKELRAPLLNLGGRKSRFILKGKIDLLIRDYSAGGGLWIVDHKTCRELPKEKDLEFDDQFGLYVWLARQLGLDVRGVIYNAVRTNKLKRPMTMEERFKRIYTVRTDHELNVIARETYEWFQNMKTPKAGLPRRSTDSDRCGWRCGFTEACLMSRKSGADIRDLLTDMGAVQDFTRH